MENREPRHYVQGLGRRSRQVAMFLAAATVPRTFQPSLMPRSNLDQGLITGTATIANYALANVIHDAIEGLASRALRGRAGRRGKRLRRFTGTGNIAAIALGLGLQSIFRQREAERTGRSAIRLLGYFITTTGYGGVAVVTQQEILAVLDRWTGHRYNLTTLPISIPVGAALSSVLELRRRRSAVTDRGKSSDEDVQASLSRSLMMGSLVATGLIAIASGERLLAIALERGTQRLLPGYEDAARPIGHVLSLGTLVAGAYAGLQHVYDNVETSAGQLEAGFDQPPASPFVSAGPGSVVTFDSLTQYPRRHVVTYLRREWIEQAMGDGVKAEPIRIYVGLDSAPTPAERVQLALAELERTGAFDRSLLMLMSPTGTGWINPSVVQAAELYTRGDVASIALQYSKRPSPMSIGRIAVGRAQNRMLFLAIHQRLYERPPERRPRVVLYGESLGAHTSQDVFLHEGTMGLRVLGIDAALWLGTPYGSEWKAEVLGVERPDVDRSLVGVFDNFEQFRRLSAEQRSALRYVLLSHENDGVTYFGPDVLMRRPDWLGSKRPAAVPPENRWLPIPSFLQTAVDMKNAQNVIPGNFQAYGHDYRSDIAQFVNAAFGLNATDQEIEKVEQALRRYELAVDRWASEHKQQATQVDSPKLATIERGA